MSAAKKLNAGEKTTSMDTVKSNRQTMLVKPNVKWFDHESSSNPTTPSNLPVDKAKQLQSRAAKLLEDDVELYKKYRETHNKRTSFHFINNVIARGTLSDRMSALIVLIQDSAVHNLHYLDSLISMVNVKAKQECVKAMETLRDLFISDLLVENRKLRTFTEHPLHLLSDISSGNKDSMDKHLILWHFEHKLQRAYGQFIMALNEVSRDTVDKTKSKAVAMMYEMLVCNREREEILLPNLVNKLGDPQHVVATRSAEKLSQLVERCPDRKATVVLEVERVLFRLNVGERAQYYSVCFLNQVLLSHDEEELASRLIAMYFAFFKAKVKKEEINTKMMSALLTGVNRAYPYAKKDDLKIQEHINTMYRIVHTVDFNISVQALMLIHRVLATQESLTDRYYSALYKQLLNPELQHSSRHALFLSLIFQSLKYDTVKSRVQAFIKRLLQICFTLPPNVICSILFLISGIVQLKPDILVLQQTLPLSILQDDDDEEERFVDVDDEKKNCEVEDSERNKNDKVKSSWHHQLNAPGGSNQQRKTGYDPHYRNPTYCGAENSFVCELILLSRHYHPSVALFAQKLLANEIIQYQGDPLQDFTLSRFLDRFVYRNPKKQIDGTNVDARQSILGRRKLYVPGRAKQIPVGSKAFISRKEHMVPADELYLYRYFVQRGAKKTGEGEDSDVDSVNSDEFEQVLSKFNPNSKDEVELDFAQEIEKQKSRRGKKVESEDSNSAESDISEDFEEDEDFKDAFKDYDEFIDNSKEDDSSDDGDIQKKDGKRKMKRSSTTQKKKKKIGSLTPELSNMFAAAEEFGNIIDENANSEVDTSTLNALANKDKSDPKQLKWEVKRDEWIRDAKWKNKKRSNQKSFNKSRSLRHANKRKTISKDKVKNMKDKRKKNKSL